MDELVSKAQVLHEALPYIRRFHQRTFVVKYGGHAMVDEALKETFPASDPIEPPRREKLPPADAPGSDVRDR